MRNSVIYTDLALLE